jgi:hypothetical protein
MIEPVQEVVILIDSLYVWNLTNVPTALSKRRVLIEVGDDPTFALVVNDTAAIIPASHVLRVHAHAFLDVVDPAYRPDSPGILESVAA